MRAVLQRVARASVRVVGASELPAQPTAIGLGFVVLLGVAESDGSRQAESLADKVAGLRVFDDPNGKMNLDLRQVGGTLLVVSQFTLLADTRRGRRPSFIRAASPATARDLYDHFVACLRDRGLHVETGTFGAHMLLEIHNDGPVTILLDTEEQNC
jgi:D-tyrosyl-tRNA(Tyr) deacylase